MHPFPIKEHFAKVDFTRGDFYELQNISITCFLTKLREGIGSILDLTSCATHFAGMLTQTQCSVD